MHKKKGIALFLVLFTSLVLFILILGLLYILGANLRQLEAYDERAKAYYLCETAASVAILDWGHGKIGTGTTKDGKPQWTERNLDLLLDGRTYPIKYTASREGGQLIFTIQTLGGFKRTYYLRTGGRRNFPIFIRGFAGR